MLIYSWMVLWRRTHGQLSLVLSYVQQIGQHSAHEKQANSKSICSYCVHAWKIALWIQGDPKEMLRRSRSQVDRPFSQLQFSLAPVIGNAAMAFNATGLSCTSSGDSSQKSRQASALTRWFPESAPLKSGGNDEEMMREVDHPMRLLSQSNGHPWPSPTCRLSSLLLIQVTKWWAMCTMVNQQFHAMRISMMKPVLPSITVWKYDPEILSVKLRILKQNLYNHSDRLAISKIGSSKSGQMASSDKSPCWNPANN